MKQAKDLEAAYHNIKPCCKHLGITAQHLVADNLIGQSFRHNLGAVARDSNYIMFKIHPVKKIQIGTQSKPIKISIGLR